MARIALFLDPWGWGYHPPPRPDSVPILADFGPFLAIFGHFLTNLAAMGGEGRHPPGVGQAAV